MRKDKPEFQAHRQFSAQKEELDLNGLNISEFERNTARLYPVIVSHAQRINGLLSGFL